MVADALASWFLNRHAHIHVKLEKNASFSERNAA